VLAQLVLAHANKLAPAFTLAHAKNYHQPPSSGARPNAPRPDVYKQHLGTAKGASASWKACLPVRSMSPSRPAMSPQ